MLINANVERELTQMKTNEWRTCLHRLRVAATAEQGRQAGGEIYFGSAI